ncbi:degenerate transposase (Orf1) [Streptococcus pneumoniae]|nr:degenerate transposase (Orf1) [Streptococcus pneumoniae]CAG5558639.1 degenerate transposase (Orf1) [Streptococcus pneumoniae]CAG5558657.1 degenerate transposase (Orf1) [Streptococcus pneumoniae]CAG5562083.1 degenerate transposase (Orf1) [Streptococcus pneumoniae]CAG5562122.1 degenerate transposase (Orf1) [Streptococcus pneumoniae]
MGLFFYNKIGSIISIVDLPTTNIIEPKLSYDDKVQIYELRKQGYSLEKLSNKFGINNSNLRYMIKLIDRYGIEFVKKGKNRYYSPDLKQEMIHKV